MSPGYSSHSHSNFHSLVQNSVDVKVGCEESSDSSPAARDGQKTFKEASDFDLLILTILTDTHHPH